LDVCIAQDREASAEEDRAFVGPEPGDALQRWYVIYVKAHHEFVAAGELARKGIRNYLPSVRRVNQWKDRRKLVEYPLFPGYVFVQAPEQPGAYLQVLQTRGVVSFVSLEPGTPAPVSCEEINALKLLIGSNMDLDVYPALKEGTSVRIKNGPLNGVQGLLSRKENELVFSINVELLGRSVAVKVAPQDIEAV
jgi:transcription termination/antitermination protein NusG